MDAVIKVFCVHTEPNYSLPWQRKRQYASTSSGFMVCGPGGERWLLTNAHSVEYSSQARALLRPPGRLDVSLGPGRFALQCQICS